MREQWTPPKCALCSDYGMRTTYILVTYEGKDKFCFKREEQITEATYNRLKTELADARKRGEDPRQYVYTGGKRCECMTKEKSA